MLTALKAMHIAALLLWCSGLFALPLMLSKHEPQQTQSHFARLRKLTDYNYRFVMTPAAVIAIAAGTALVFVRSVYEPWMFAKMAAVGLLVCLHTWQGWAVMRMGETAGQARPPGVLLMTGFTVCVIGAVLLLVLGKPPLPADLLPGWLMAPRYRPLPVEEPPG